MELRRRAFILFMVIIFSTAKDIKEQLFSTVGGSITLPELVEDGFLSFRQIIIAQWNEGSIRITDKNLRISNRLFRNDSSGLITLTKLQRNDSGVYTFQSIDGSISNYGLKVYEPIRLDVLTLNDSADSCTLQCSVKDAENTSVFWKVHGRVLNQISSNVSLPLTVYKWDLNSSYSCVAKNPAEVKTVEVNVEDFCSRSSKQSLDKVDGATVAVVVIVIILVVIVILASIFIKLKYCDKDKGTSSPTEEYPMPRTSSQIEGSVSRDADVLYAEVQINVARPPPRPPRSPNLTTVYDELQAGRMNLSQTDTDHRLYEKTSARHT